MWSHVGSNEVKGGQRWGKLGFVGGWVMKSEFGRGLVTFGWKRREVVKGGTMKGSVR
jgi:hypothetical protein